MLLLVAGTAKAQEMPTYPLSADPARAVYAPTAEQRTQGLRRGTAALALPFFDDFTTPLEGAPKVRNWLPTGGALVNNRFALQPPTRGTATLDGIKADGRNYSGLVTSPNGNLDSLISQPINLGGLTTTDNVYLSFAWQAGSIVGNPNNNASSSPVRLELFAKTDLGDWISVWREASTGQRTPFRQKVISLNEGRYLHGDFQFMFVATGDRSESKDTWSVDYVVLDRGRTLALADTTFNDVAISAGLRGGNPSGGLNSPLRRFSAMPVWQFNAAGAAQLNRRLGVNIYNLSPGNTPIPIGVQGTLRALPAGPLLSSWVYGNRPVLANPRLDSVNIPANTQPPPTTPTAKTLRYTIALGNPQETNLRTQPNDTIFRDVELNNYYAYDDGTAENYVSLLAQSVGQAQSFAYRFDLNQPDYVGGLRLYPVFTAADASDRAITVSVWSDVAGQPSPLPVASKSAVVRYPTPGSSSGPYTEITFDTPVPVTGTFYVGFSQASVGRTLHYGFDLNSSFPPGYLWVRDNAGVWDSIRFAARRGALMMRPVMTNNVVTATASAREAAAFSFYPNPTHGTVTIAGLAFARAAVLDALGRTVWQQSAAQAGKATLELSALQAGLYTLRLTLPDGRTVGRRLMLE
ncbi:T9SS type A sorting domain-containing protein [Hymenobacter terrenus]|uniref:T9SS type A sorting domain-containing protein n=1 Tax=Hymenobacter terrenus TaxID=1629124 RepID=UPI000619971E|nr:T9SS type A sorting domain-containing protein [Hymenobacter terrenus]